MTLPPEPLYLDADLTRLAQVFWNLLNNSAKYTDPGGRIELSARSKEAGFNFHMVKPVEPAALENLLAELLTPR